MTVLEELLSKTEYIYILGTDGRPQMPSKRKRHILKISRRILATLVVQLGGFLINKNIVYDF